MKNRLIVDLKKQPCYRREEQSPFVEIKFSHAYVMRLRPYTLMYKKMANFEKNTEIHFALLTTELETTTSVPEAPRR